MNLVDLIGSALAVLALAVAMLIGYGIGKWRAEVGMFAELANGLIMTGRIQEHYDLNGPPRLPARERFKTLNEKPAGLRDRVHGG